MSDKYVSKRYVELASAPKNPGRRGGYDETTIAELC